MLLPLFAMALRLRDLKKMGPGGTFVVAVKEHLLWEVRFLGAARVAAVTPKELPERNQPFGSSTPAPCTALLLVSSALLPLEHRFLTNACFMREDVWFEYKFYYSFSNSSACILLGEKQVKMNNLDSKPTLGSRGFL